MRNLNDGANENVHALYILGGFMKKSYSCEDCKDTGFVDNDEVCTECCPHDELECGHCIECGEVVGMGVDFDPYD